jgi:hypothetical protein
MICPYSFDEPIGSGIPSLLDGRYWCMGWIEFGMSARRRRCPEDCPVDFGPWGAWRACADMLTAIYTGLEESGAMDVPIIVFSWGETATNYDLFRNIAWDELGAVGWSP